jgi:uncharacterized protein (DUF433 family)
MPQAYPLSKATASGYHQRMTSQPISLNKNIQGGTPCFTGTRVPVSSLFDHLEQSVGLDEFLADFPTVSREQAVAVLELAKIDCAKHAVMCE